MISLLELFALSDPTGQVCQLLGIAKPERPEPDLDAIVKQFGPEEVAKLIRFSVDWKHVANGRHMPNLESRIPDLNLCRRTFGKLGRDVAVYRGLVILDTVPLAKRSVGDVVEVNLRKRSIASWTIDRYIAHAFSGTTGDEDAYSPPYAGQVGVVVKLLDPQDVVVMASFSGWTGAPTWYRDLLKRYTDHLNLPARFDAYQFELTLGVKRAKVEIVHRMTHEEYVGAPPYGDRRRELTYHKTDCRYDRQRIYRRKLLSKGKIT